MAEASSAVIICGACNKRFAWKPELAGKRVKCKCGQAISVPAAAGKSQNAMPRTPAVLKQGIAPLAGTQIGAPAPRPVVPSVALPSTSIGGGDLDDLYALAEDADRAAAAMPVEVADFAPMAVAAPVKKTNRLAAAGGIPLAYQGGPSAREHKRAAEAAAALVDPRRDYHAPLVILIVGIISYMSYFVVRYHLPAGSIPAVGFGVVVLTVFKAALLVGFALGASGPLGVGFGSLWSAVLKLAAIAVFVDGATAWVDLGVVKMAGGVGGGGAFGWGIISWPVAAGLYWGLLIYLFSMDSGDSWLIVVCLSMFDRAVKFVLFMLLLNVILGWGGIAAPPSLGGGIAGNSALAHTSALATRVDHLKEVDALIEAKKYIADGHQAVLSKSVDAWYTNGCPNVWFEMSGKDINSHRSAQGLIVELPTDKTKRAKCFGVLKGYYDDIGSKADPEDLKDTGDDYLDLFLR